MNNRFTGSVIGAIVLFVITASVMFFSETYLTSEKEPAGDTKVLSEVLPYDAEVNEKADEYIAEWYLESVEIMQENDPPEAKDTVADFIVLDSMSFAGIKYINVKIYPDNTGKMTYRYFSSESLYKEHGVMLSESSVDLEPEQTAKVAELFESNNFWSLPTEHPDEVPGCDGATTFIEGALGDKYNFIHMWMPDEKYEISKISRGIYDYGKEWGIDFEIDEDKVKELEEKTGILFE